MVIIVGVIVVGFEWKLLEVVLIMIFYLSNVVVLCVFFVMGVSIVFWLVGWILFEMLVVLGVKFLVYLFLIFMFLFWIGGFDLVWVVIVVLMVCFLFVINVFVIV